MWGWGIDRKGKQTGLEKKEWGGTDKVGPLNDNFFLNSTWPRNSGNWEVFFSAQLDTTTQPPTGHGEWAAGYPPI
jgi:hypothetical protein